MILDVGHASHPGRVHEYNGDYCSGVQHWVTDAQLAEKGRLFVIADGIGGASSAESSRHAINRLYQLYYTYPSNHIRRSLQHAIHRVNNEILAESKRQQSPKCVMLAAAVLRGNGLTIATVGRIRAYLYHKGQLRQLTTDRPLEEVLPPPPPPGADSTPEADLRPLRSLGSSRHSLVDFYGQRLGVGDVLLFVTDGLYQVVSAEEIRQAIADSDKPQLAADHLSELASDHDNEDNATALLVSAVGQETSKAALPFLASWLLWGTAGVALVATAVTLVMWMASFVSLRAMPLPTPTNTARPVVVSELLRPTPTPLPTEQVTPTATSTRAPTATEAPILIVPQNTPTVAPPTATVTLTAKPLPVLYNAPRVIAPYNDEGVYQGENNQLVWQWYRQLLADESFEVRLWPEGSEPPARGSLQTSTMELRFGVPAGQAGKYLWNVVVVRKSAEGSAIVSVPSETRFFWWMGPRPQAPTPPTATPPPPTNTPVPPTNTPVPPTPTPLP